MKLASFEAIARALQDSDVRYLVAGGLAVNAMKVLAGRPRDLDDVGHLRWIQEDLDRRGPDS